MKRIKKHGTKLGEIDELKSQLLDAQAEIQYQRKTFDALLLISQSLGESPTIDDVFKQAIQPIQEITRFNIIGLSTYITTTFWGLMLIVVMFIYFLKDKLVGKSEAL